MTVVRSGTDAWVAEGAPAQNYGQAARLWLNGGTSGNDKQGLVYLKSPAPLGATIFAATLRLHARGAWAGSQTLTVRRLIEKWAESTVNWNTKPSSTATNEATLAITGAADGDTFEVDVTNLIQDAASGSAYYGVRLSISVDSDRAVHSTEATDATLRPQLEVTWSSPPEAPTSLAPAGGNAISGDTPILSWVYKDPGAGSGEGQSSSQVQISTTTSFASPEYDSGKVANTEQSWDLSATAYAGVPDGETRYWRVRVWDDTDLVSDYADTASFQRVAKGSLTLDTPSGGSFEDLTPLISWTLTGAVQEAYRVIIQNLTQTPALDPGGTYVQDTGKVTGTATSVRTIPGRINDHDTYRITVRVWDTDSRQGIPGDPNYTEVQSADLSYTRAGVGTAVTGLAATLVESDGPGVKLDFNRSSAPDYFALKVDDVVVEPRLLPSDLFISGTAYRYTYWGATPRVSHTYEVEAVTLSGGVYQHSSGNSTDTLTTDPNGVWLIDPSDNTRVKIVGTDSPEMSIGESGATFAIIGSRAPVRITDTVRGYEGSISGLLLGKTARDTFLTLKGRLTELQLVVGDVAIAVMLEEVSATPTPLRDDVLYGCSFGFVQVDDFTFTVVA